jgi:long-chain acyl-CoA synthetase
MINSFYDIIERNYKQKADSTVIVQNDIVFSNKQFKQQIDECAGKLHFDLQIMPGDRVAIFMHNCWQFIASICAISKIGAIPVIINHFITENELITVLNNSDAKFLISSFKLADVVANVNKNTGVKTIIMNGIPHNVKLKDSWVNYENFFYTGEIKEITIAKPKAEDLAIIFYTSGTIGAPKGVCLSYKNIFSNIIACQQHLGLTPKEAQMICYLPMFHSFNFTVTIMLPLYFNSFLVIIQGLSGSNALKGLFEAVVKFKVCYFVGVPQIFNKLSKIKIPLSFQLAHRVKGFICGSAPLAVHVMEDFNKILKFSQKWLKKGYLLQGYGLTEHSPVVATNQPRHNKLGSVGRPLPGVTISIRSDQGQELKIDSVGEIFIKSDSVMMGYLNKEDATNDVIQDGWLKTGDIGKIDKDGFLYILDRKKDLIISKGMNIYPSEIESVIATNDKVNAVGVIGMQDDDLDEYAVAYIETKEGATLTEEEVKKSLSGLARYKHPKYYFILPEIPKNAMGKVLKSELRKDIKTRLKK